MGKYMLSFLFSWEPPAWSLLHTNKETSRQAEGQSWYKNVLNQKLEHFDVSFREYFVRHVSNIILRSPFPLLALKIMTTWHYPLMVSLLPLFVWVLVLFGLLFYFTIMFVLMSCIVSISSLHRYPFGLGLWCLTPLSKIFQL
jgi:hypothetical protein